MSTNEKLAFFKYPFSKYPLQFTKVVGFAENLHRIPSDTCKQTPYLVRKCAIFQWKWYSINIASMYIKPYWIGCAHRLCIYLNWIWPDWSQSTYRGTVNQMTVNHTIVCYMWGLKVVWHATVTWGDYQLWMHYSRLHSVTYMYLLFSWNCAITGRSACRGVAIWSWYVHMNLDHMMTHWVDVIDVHLNF